jgi:hypothetical protein
MSIPSEPTNKARLAAMLGMTERSIHNLANEGLVIKEGRRYLLDASVLAYVQYLRSGQRPTGSPAQPADPDNLPDLAVLLERAKSATDKNAAQTVKTQIDALRSGFSLEVEQGRYISREQVDEGLIATITHLRSAILSMAGELPPHLEGLPAAEVERQLRIYADRMITDLKDSLDRLGETAQDEPAKPSPKLAKPRGRPKKPRLEAK